MPGFIDFMCAKSGLLERMIDRLSLRRQIKELNDAPGVMRRATIRCLSCGHSEACSAWLDEHPDADEAPLYCRNHDLFERIRPSN